MSTAYLLGSLGTLGYSMNYYYLRPYTKHPSPLAVAGLEICIRGVY